MSLVLNNRALGFTIKQYVVEIGFLTVDNDTCNGFLDCEVKQVVRTNFIQEWHAR